LGAYVWPLISQNLEVKKLYSTIRGHQSSLCQVVRQKLTKGSPDMRPNGFLGAILCHETAADGSGIREV